MSPRKRRTYTDEQRANAVRLVHETGNLSRVSRDLGLTASTLHRWVKRAGIDAGDGKPGEVTSTERDELQRLRRENRILLQEREFLKKATAFFAKEQDPRSR